MSIMDMFKTTPAAPQQQQQPQPGNLPPSEPAPTDGQIPATPVASNEELGDPLAQYKDLWETTNNGQEPDNNGFVPIDAAKLQQVVGKASFTNGITAQQMAAINEGGDGAMAAFTQALDSVARQVMTQSTLTANKMAEQAVARAMESTQKNLPNMLKKHTTLTSNPLFSNPAVKPVIEAVQAQLTAKHPNATAAELSEMAQNFVIAMGESFSPKPVAPGAPLEQDFSHFLE